jgi:hypothetical protein
MSLAVHDADASQVVRQARLQKLIQALTSFVQCGAVQIQSGANGPFAAFEAFEQVRAAAGSYKL